MVLRRGFTLIELAVVLVIIGLLVGGVLAGQSLMKSQKLRNTLQDAKAYAIAKQLFLDKYSYLPGDMPTATRVWGNADGSGDPTVNCAAPETYTSVGKLTCNGDGNGIVENTGSENFRAWQHLSAAGMLVGTFTGIHGPGGSNDAISGINVPSAALDGALFHFEKPAGDQIATMDYYEGNYDNVLLLGGQVSGSDPYAPVLSGLEAFEMDKKLDDGLPGTGRIRTYPKTWMEAHVGVCVSNDHSHLATYELSNGDAPQCILLFMSGFQAKPE